MNQKQANLDVLSRLNHHNRKKNKKIWLYQQNHITLIKNGTTFLTHPNVKLHQQNVWLLHQHNFICFHQFRCCKKTIFFEQWLLKGNLATPSSKLRFWRITHFRAAISRIGRRRFVNIIITYLNIKKWPT